MQKLPVFRTIGRTLKASWQVPFRLPLLFLISLALLAGAWAISPAVKSYLGSISDGAAWVNLSFQYAYPIIVSALLCTPLRIGLIRWHLLGEANPVLPVLPLRRFGYVAIWYLVLQVLAILPLAGSTLLGSVYDYLTAQHRQAILLLLSCLVIVPTYRWFFTTVFAALDAPAAGRQSWRQTKGSFWRLLWITVGVGLLTGFVSIFCVSFLASLRHIPFNMTVDTDLFAWFSRNFAAMVAVPVAALGSIIASIINSVMVAVAYQARSTLAVPPPRIVEVFN